VAYILFVDESGQDRRDSPYEVLAGVAVEDSRIWNIISSVHDAEERFFGQRITEAVMELKAKKLLKRKTFRLAQQLPPMQPASRTGAAQACLAAGRQAKCGETAVAVSRLQLTALAQAKLAFVERLFEICAHHQVRVIASIVDRDSPQPEGHFLRKDYAYLFERFFYFLDEQPSHHQGLVVFDELERSRSHILIDQMHEYFLNTAKGRLRASRVIPEPFFVHSYLTSLVQVADLVAYIIAWGVRVGGMQRPARPELQNFARAVCDLRHRATRERDGEPFHVWSLAVIDDLRPRGER
jgi:hypothetical protein